MLKLKLQYFGHLMQRIDSLEKTLMLGGIAEGAVTRPCIDGKRPPGSKYRSTSGLSPREHLERQAEFHASTQDEA